jgi:hypothetical protein
MRIDYLSNLRFFQGDSGNTGTIGGISAPGDDVS